MPSSSPQQPSNLLKECWWEIWVKIKYQVQASPLQPLLFFLMFTSITFLCTSKFWLGLEVKRPKCQEGGKGLSRPGFSKGQVSTKMYFAGSSCTSFRVGQTIKAASMAHVLPQCRVTDYTESNTASVLEIIFWKVCYHQQSIEYWGLDTQARFQHSKLHLCGPLRGRWMRKPASKNNQKFSLINRRENKTGQGLNFMTLSTAAF